MCYTILKSPEIIALYEDFYGKPLSELVEKSSTQFTLIAAAIAKKEKLKWLNGNVKFADIFTRER